MVTPKVLFYSLSGVILICSLLSCGLDYSCAYCPPNEGIDPPLNVSHHVNVRVTDKITGLPISNAKVDFVVWKFNWGQDCFDENHPDPHLRCGWEVSEPQEYSYTTNSDGSTSITLSNTYDDKSDFLRVHMYVSNPGYTKVSTARKTSYLVGQYDIDVQLIDKSNQP